VVNHRLPVAVVAAVVFLEDEEFVNPPRLLPRGQANPSLSASPVFPSFHPHLPVPLTSLDEPVPTFSTDKRDSADSEEETPQLLMDKPQLPVGCRLLHFKQIWEQHTTDAHLIQMVTSGVQIDFADVLPPLSRDPLPLREGGDLWPILQPHVEDMIRKGAVVRVPDNMLGFRSRVFLVPKKTGDLRPVINLKPLNQFIKKEKFKMETQRAIRAAVQQGDWVVSIDLKDAFFHIPIDPKFQKYLLFQAGGS